jgi:outer membrane immunogenic protein
MHNLAKGMLSTVSWLALAATAGAADLVTKAPPPQAAPVMLWTGPYVGLSVGAYSHRASSSELTPGFPGFDGSLTDTSAFVSGHAGYNWQVNRFVLGVEGDISSPTRSATITYGPPPANNDETFTTKIHWLSTIRGRVGVTFSNLLLYATGGLAIADISNVRNNPIILGVLARDEGVRTAGVVGAGAEYKLSQQWSVRLEGLWMKFPDAEFNSPGVGAPPQIYRTRFTNEVAMVRGGVSLSW